MSRNLPPKSSSRAGRFKKKLVSAETLLIEAPFLSVKTSKILGLFERGIITGAELTGLYIISILSHRFPGTWPGAKRDHEVCEHNMNLELETVYETLQFEPNVRSRLSKLNTLGELFANFALKSTPLAVNRSLLKWSTEDYGLELMFRIPTPHEVLMQQKSGRRCVSVLTRTEQMSKYVLGERDALSFTMHDLIHADHFYHDNQCYQGQLGFYGLLDQCLCQGHFRELMETEKFKHEFEYLISDMNAYAVHLMKCLKSAMIHYHPMRMDFFNSWLDNLGLQADIRNALLELNGADYSAKISDEVILRWLETYREKLSLRA